LKRDLKSPQVLFTKEGDSGRYKRKKKKKNEKNQGDCKIEE